MANNGSIKKQIKDIEETEKKVNKVRYRVQCTCNHREHGDACLTWVESNKDGHSKKAYMCQKCKKKINPETPKVDEILKAVETLETASDYMRMFIPGDSEEDIEKLEWHGKVLENNAKLCKSYIKMKGYQEKKAKENKNRRAKHGSSSFMA